MNSEGFVLGNFEIDFIAQSHVMRAVALIRSDPNYIDFVIAMPNWCSRPYNITNPVNIRFNENDSIPYYNHSYGCVTPQVRHSCTQFLQGLWINAESGVTAAIGNGTIDLNDEISTIVR